MTEPVRAPEGARLVRPDGSVLPLELVYEGVDEDGIHQWSATAAFNPETDVVKVDVMPGRTSLGLRLADSDLDNDEFPS